jgi:DNA-binding response OmpR family regulator
VAERLWVDTENGVAGYGTRALALTTQEVAVLAALADAGGRVVSRDRLAREAGLGHVNPRRAENLLVTLRRQIGCGAVRTVRGRGWALDADAIVMPD